MALQARLEISDRLGQRTVAIDTALLTIGRSAERDLRVAGSEVSRDHAEILREGDRFILRDRGSRYGTFVNGELVTERELNDGDHIRLGRSGVVELVFSGHRQETTTSRSVAGTVRQTAALLEGLRALGAGHLLDDVLALVLDAAIELAGADRGFIMLAASDGTLEFTLGRDRGGVTLSGKTFATSHKIPEHVFATGEVRIVSDLFDENLADAHMATVALGIRHVLCVPLMLMRYLDRPAVVPEEKRIGVLYLDSHGRGTLLSPATRIGVEGLAIEAAVAIENARLYRETLEKERVDQELRIAAEMQRALLPASRYETPSFEIAGASLPSRSIGGDFYDYVQLSSGAFGFALADVAGKGPPAAVLAAALQGMFAACAAYEHGPAATLTRVNQTLVRRPVESRFATMAYGVLALDGMLTYCNAGHNPPVLFRQGTTRRLERGGVALGFFQGSLFEEEQLQLVAGDVLVLFSDGVSEAVNDKGEDFGDDRIAASVGANLELDAALVLDRLLLAVRQFSEGTVQQDDVTALVLRYHGA